MVGTTQQTREALAERLRLALGPRPLRWLARELMGASDCAPDLRGVTAAALGDYFEARRTAPLELVRAIAEVLNKDWVWLATGEISVSAQDRLMVQAAFDQVTMPPPALQPTSQSGKPKPQGAPKAVDWVATLRAADPLLGDLDQQHMLVLVELVREGFDLQGVDRPTPRQITDAGIGIAEALRLPSKLTGTNLADLDAWNLGLYIDAFRGVVRLGIPRLKAGRPGRPKAGGEGGGKSKGR